jgi:hypothetical protein
MASSFRFTFNVLAKRTGDSLFAEGLKGTNLTTWSSPDVTPSQNSPRGNWVQCVSNMALVKLTLGRNAQLIWMFVAKNLNQIVLGTGRSAVLRRGGGFEAPPGTIGRGRVSLWNPISRYLTKRVQGRREYSSESVMWATKFSCWPKAPLWPLRTCHVNGACNEQLS